MLALCVGVAAAGCGRESEQPVVWQASETLPEDFPKNVPVYPKATLKTVVRGMGAVIFWETPDPVETVKDFYTRELAANGWTVTTYPGLAASWMGEGGLTLIATGWGRRVSFALGEQGDRTAITAVMPNL